jgi:hypothetical protein
MTVGMIDVNHCCTEKQIAGNCEALSQGEINLRRGWE